MEIYKFGGTSVGNAESIKRVAEIINNETEKIVVLSANGKTTDTLAAIIEDLEKGNIVEIAGRIKNLEKYYFGLLTTLFSDYEFSQNIFNTIKKILHEIKLLPFNKLQQTDKDFIITRGEIISTLIFSKFLEKNHTSHILLQAKEIIYLDIDGNPDRHKIKQNINSIIENTNHSTYIIQGFLCSNSNGKISTLGRGGSDFTASLLGEAVNASVIQIWSDVDGFLNNDPNFVRGALPLKYLSFDESAELAYFGARILHPSTIFPAKEAGIPVLLKNTNDPLKPGTVISEKRQSGKIKAVAAKDGIYVITIHSHKMLMAYGFLKKVFEVFEKHKTSVDMVTTSEVSISITIDNNRKLFEITDELKNLGEVSINKGMSLICIVGDHLADNKGKVMEIFTALKDIPVKMISYGAAKNSITFLVQTSLKVAALESIHSLQEISNQIYEAYV
jgi:aspartate kinase